MLVSKTPPVKNMRAHRLVINNFNTVYNLVTSMLCISKLQQCALYGTSI